jgi:GT2 family glycosyltransferase
MPARKERTAAAAARPAGMLAAARAPQVRHSRMRHQRARLVDPGTQQALQIHGRRAASARTVRGQAVEATIVIPSFDEPRLIATLRALHRESHARARVVIVDNSADAGTARALAARFPWAVFLHEPTPGSYSARVRGVAAAEGGVLAFLDADCVPFPGWLDAGLRALADGADAVAGRVLTRWTGIGPKPLAALYDERTAVPQDHYVRNGCAAGGNLFVRRAAYDAVGGFDTRLKSGGDGLLSRAIHDAGFKLCYSPEAIVVHPARASLKELMAKGRRVYRGLRRLHDEAWWPWHRKLTYAARAALPWPRAVRRLLVTPGEPLARRFAMVALHAFLRLYNAFCYLRGGEPPRR